jgi:hypothetical protein
MNKNRSIDIKNKVDCLLMESDWTQMPNANLSLIELEAWDIYRLKLNNFLDEIHQQELMFNQCVDDMILPDKPE